MKLFEVIPERLFLIFSGKNKQIYAEALLLIYEQYHIYKFGIQYNVLRDLMQELIESQEEAGQAFEVEEEQEQPTTLTFEEDIFRIKANALLRRLEKTGWIQIEIREKFNQFVVLPHYTSRLLGLFRELCENRTVEYQRFAFITYQLLTGEESKMRPSFVVLEAERMTQQFLDELKILINNMKNHMEQVATKSTIQEVLAHHFDEYKAKIIDRSYHRLKTSDHVSRYRQKILETIQKWLLDREWLEICIMDSIKNEFFNSRDDASQRLREILLNIEEIYRGLDDVFYQIDLRHNQYLRSSFDRARYLSQHSQGIDQYLAEILEELSHKIERRQELTEVIGSNEFHLFDVNEFLESSIFKPRKRRPPFQPEEIINIDIPEELRQKLREKSLTKISKVISRDKIKSYVLEHLNTRDEMGIEELVPHDLTEFLYLIYVYLYGYDGTAGYRLIRDEQSKLLVIGEYRFNYRRVERIASSQRGDSYVS